MNLKEKINSFLSSVGSTQQKFAAEIGVNYQHMNKNIAAGKLTPEVFLGLKKIYPQIDLNWLADDGAKTKMLLEPESSYSGNTLSKIEQIRNLLNEIENELEQKNT